jgi:hypothetical protein
MQVRKNLGDGRVQVMQIVLFMEKPMDNRMSAGVQV